MSGKTKQAISGKIEVQQKVNEFMVAYTALCKEYGFELRPAMGWKQQIDGTFTVSLQLQVTEIGS